MIGATEFCTQTLYACSFSQLNAPASLPIFGQCRHSALLHCLWYNEAEHHASSCMSHGTDIGSFMQKLNHLSVHITDTYRLIMFHIKHTPDTIIQFWSFALPVAFTQDPVTCKIWCAWQMHWTAKPACYVLHVGMPLSSLSNPIHASHTQHIRGCVDYAL